jgi:opacity protein-like surface antigen
MRKLGCAALFAACIVAAPVASAGDFFINGQQGRINLDSGGFDNEQTNFAQGSVGYRWGIGIAQVGLETGLGKPEDQNDRTRSVYTDGYTDHTYAYSSRYAFVGANARIKPPLMPVYLIGRAGYLGLERKVDETSVDHYLDTSPVTERRAFRENDGGVYYGAGIGTSILPLLDISLMYNKYRYSQVQYDPTSDEYRLSDNQHDAHSVSVSVEYRF